MKYLIKHQVINADHIVRAEYTPADSGIDDEDGEPYSHKSSCKITMTSVSLEEASNYEGTVYGVAATSDVIKLCDVDADRFWEVYSGDAYQVVTK